MTDLLHPTTGHVLFYHSKLASPDTGEVRLATGFADLLVALRVAFGKPMVLNSCCRTGYHNKAVDGHPRSLHLINNPVHKVNGCCAMDVRHTHSAAERWKLVKLAQDRGWSVGVAKDFTHFDRREMAGLAPGLFGY